MIIIFVLEPQAYGALCQYKRAIIETIGKAAFLHKDLSDVISKLYKITVCDME